MIKVFDYQKKFLFLLDSLRNCRITESLELGYKNLIFQVPCSQINLESFIEENYIETSDYCYVIKEVNVNGDFITVYCNPDIEEITGKIFQIFDLFELSLEEGYRYCLSNSNWDVEYNSTKQTQITYQGQNKTSIDMIRRIAREHKQELWFDTKNKVLKVYDRMGKDLGSYFSNELRLKELKKQSSSYGYYTVVYPYGKNGLDISSVNGGKKYLSDYTYTNKQIEKVIVNNGLTYAEDVLRWGQGMLEEYSQPKSSYQLKLSSIQGVELGDSIMLVDKLKRIKQKQRVVKIVRYPFEPEKSTLDISNIQVDFSRQWKSQKKEWKEDVDYLRSVIENA